MKTKKKQLIWVWALTVVLLALFAGLLVYLNTPAPGETPTSASLRNYVPARVTTVLGDNGEADDWTEGRRLGTQQLEVMVLSGPYKGVVLQTANYMSAYFNLDLKEGASVIIQMDLEENGRPYVVSIWNHNRGLALGGLVLFFVLLLMVIGGWKGVKALLGLVFTLVALWLLLIPLILRGVPPIPATIALVVLTTAVSLLLLNGFSRKTLCATLGCVGGVAAAGLLAALMGALTRLNGFNMPEAEDLVLRATDQGLTISGLLVCGILISALGAVMDVAMSISSACHELREINPKLGRGDLFRSGMNIGRDAMGTMANTLILAFVGSSLNMLILFRVFDYPALQLLNSDLMVIEIMQGICGSIGIVLTVPLVAFISAWIMSKKKM